MQNYFPINKYIDTYQGQLFLLGMYEDIEKIIFSQTKYLVLTSDNDKNFLQSISKTISIDSVFDDMEKLVNYVQKNRGTYFRIVSTQMHIKQICQKMKSIFNIVNVCGYTCDSQLAGELSREYDQKALYSVDVNVLDLCDSLSRLSKINEKFNVFPNFLMITGKQKSELNKLRYILHGLLKIKDSKAAKSDFCGLVNYLYRGNYDELSKIKSFINTYKCEFELKQVFEWYTKQCFYYKILNNMLRASNNPVQLAYVRLPFMHLHTAIKTMFQQQPKENITLFRGGMMSEADFQDLMKIQGGYIETLGFMSTTPDEQVARKFLSKINPVLFIISVLNQPREQANDYGYVSIQQFSVYSSESQFLFNALNVFKIEKVIKNAKCNQIHLKYGELSNICYKQNNHILLTEEEELIYNNYMHQKQNFDRINTQGDILMQCQQYKTAIIYYQTNISLQRQKPSKLKLVDICNNRIKQGIAYQYLEEYSKSLQYYEKALELFRFNKDPYNIKVATIEANIGNLKIKIGKDEEAILHYKNSIEIRKKNGIAQDNVENVKLYINMGVWYQTRDTQTSLLYYNQALSLQLKANKKMHKDTALIYINLASMMGKVEQFASCVQYKREALEIYRNLLGQYHSQTANAYHSLALTYFRMTRFDSALQYFTQAISIRIKIFKQSNEGINENLYYICKIYEKKRLYEKCLELINKHAITSQVFNELKIDCQIAILQNKLKKTNFA